MQMLRVSIGFLLIGLFAMSLGLGDGWGVSFEQGRLLLFIFLALSILTFIGALVFGHSEQLWADSSSSDLEVPARILN